ncbi:NADP-dependent oxidoreductase [Streptacidiphilus pinicola]|uniref:NADP-dependent oxidoreductase n=1 Tax=Streptacidiphilus pinicola TaxID=2219663 RepID=A0A2X0KJU9_9ACTN|nr:NADP-dependent oxidoreductase [Streptacidiphilus pinicola]RAG86990.1 NADP-dependent oxidoreductase [Streptacidiphilus pinicola]
MKAVGVTQFGGPESLHMLDLPVPEASPGEIRIKVSAAGVNAIDSLIRRGLAVAPTAVPPFVPGMDAAGVVDQIGQGTETDLRVGDRVMAIVVPNQSHGAYAQYVTVPARSVVKAPVGASDAQAASLPMNGLTARLALDTLGLAPGQTLAVTGAAGAVGGYVIQLAKDDGLKVIADASPKDEALVKELGADLVLPRGPEYAQQVRAHVPEGVDALVDAASLGELATPAVRDQGMMVSVRGGDGVRERGVVIKSIVVFSYAQEQVKLDRLRQQAKDGQLTLRVAQVLPFDQAQQAHQLLDAGGLRGRIVLQL